MNPVLEASTTIVAIKKLAESPDDAVDMSMINVLHTSELARRLVYIHICVCYCRDRDVGPLRSFCRHLTSPTFPHGSAEENEFVSTICSVVVELVHADLKEHASVLTSTGAVSQSGDDVVGRDNVASDSVGAWKDSLSAVDFALVVMKQVIAPLISASATAHIHLLRIVVAVRNRLCC